MDIKSKLQYVKSWITTISRRDSTDAVIRYAALDEVEKHITAERAAIGERLQAKVAEFATPTPASTDQDPHAA